MKWMEKNNRDCKNATSLIEKKLHTPLEFGERLQLQLHLYGCSWCKTYQHQSQQIELMIGHIFSQNRHRSKKLDDNFKKQLELLITSNLK